MSFDECLEDSLALSKIDPTIIWSAAVVGRPPYHFGHAGRVTLPFVPAARSVIAPYQNFGSNGHA